MSVHLPGFTHLGLEAYQCPVCHGIAYNPVCPYCAEDDEDDPGREEGER